MTEKHKVIVFDLDDTLYKEIDFLKSAYREIADYFRDEFGIYGLWGEMLRYYGEKKDVFQEVIDFYKRPVKKDFLLEMYRAHKPCIHLDDDTKETLDYLVKNKHYDMAIITDGRSLTQRNKAEALGLYDYLKDEQEMIISEEIRHTKLDDFAFELVETFYPDCDYTYIGDNPEKDFLVPNSRLWKTICLRNNGRNIHDPNFDVDKIYLAKHEIDNIKEIIGII